MRSPVLRLLGAVALSTLVVSCGDSAAPTSPAPLQGAGPNRLLLGTPKVVQVVTRTTPITTTMTASTTIGLLGGRLSLPGAGLSVVIPPLAARSGTRITVPAVKGSMVAYEFQPHGIQFTTPLLVTQNLTGTSAYTGGLLNTNLVAGYFASTADLNLLSNTGLVSELLSTTLSLVGKSVTFPVFHFSGYLVATGAEEEGLVGGFDGR